MVTRERAMAMVHNALTRQAEENEQHMRAMERESAIVIKKAMTRFREERSENKALREHLGEQEATIARLASRVRTQDKAMASLRLELTKKTKTMKASQQTQPQPQQLRGVHFALAGRPSRANDDNSEEGLSLEDII